jgi:hypothetical protein
MFIEIWTSPWGLLMFIEFHLGQCCGMFFGAW